MVSRNIWYHLLFKYFFIEFIQQTLKSILINVYDVNFYINITFMTNWALFIKRQQQKECLKMTSFSINYNVNCKSKITHQLQPIYSSHLVKLSHDSPQDFFLTWFQQLYLKSMLKSTVLKRKIPAFLADSYG